MISESGCGVLTNTDGGGADAEACASLSSLCTGGPMVTRRSHFAEMKFPPWSNSAGRSRGARGGIGVGAEDDAEVWSDLE